MDEEIVGTVDIQETTDDDRNDRRTKVIWSAGFFDGEGTVGMVPLKSGSRSLRIAVGQLVMAPLRILQNLYGGSIVPDSSMDKPFWRWTITADKAMAALVEMEPWLTVKGEQARIGIEFQEGKAGRPRFYQDSKHRQREYMRKRRKGEKASLDERPTMLISERDRWKDFMVRIQKARP